MKPEPRPWTERPALTLNLDLPPAERYAALPDEVIARGRALMLALHDQAPASLRALAEAVHARTGGRFREATEALARRLDLDARDLTLANISYDLMLASMACSTLALPTPDGPVIMRNMDWWPEGPIARASYLTRFERGGRLVCADAGVPIGLGIVSGLSANGFAVVLNAAGCAEGADITGYPVLLYLREVIEDAADFDDALEHLRAKPLAAPGMITLVGVENRQRVVIERAPRRHALRWGEEGRPLITTNHYRALDSAPLEGPGRAGEAAKALNASTCGRHEALCRAYPDWPADRALNPEAVLATLASDEVAQEITAQHVLLCPATQSARLWTPTRLLGGAA